jgi:hypothetical protein
MARPGDDSVPGLFLLLLRLVAAWIVWPPVLTIGNSVAVTVPGPLSVVGVAAAAVVIGNGNAAGENTAEHNQ